MSGLNQDGHRTSTAVLKVLYLLSVTIVVFVVPALSLTRFLQWVVIAGLLAIQVIALLFCRIGVRGIVRPPWRLKWLFVFLIAAYAFLPAENVSDVRLTWPLPGGWALTLNLTGLVHATLMCIQITTVLLASALVRLTGGGNDLLTGLHAFRLPALFVHSLDQTLELLGGARRSGGGRGGGKRSGGGGGKGGGGGAGSGGTDELNEPAVARQSHRLGFFAIVNSLVRGDVGVLVQAVQTNIEVATERTKRDGSGHLNAQMAHDVAVVTGIALCMASLKILKFLPGIPFASGHKGFLLIPLYVLASRLTYSRWGGTAAGTIMGVIGFLQGDGRFGVFEILKHVVPGILIDLADPLMRRLPQWAFTYCVLGVVAAAARTTTEFIIVLLLGARAEIFIFPVARLVPNLLAGLLSGFVTIFLLRAFATATPSPDNAPGVQASAAAPEAAEACRPGNTAASEQIDARMVSSVAEEK